MRRRSHLALLLAALFLCGPISCFKSNTNNSMRKNPPPDPLLQSKTPVQSRYGTTSDVHANPDPCPPAMPGAAWVSAPAKTPSGKPEPGPYRWTSEKRDVPKGSNERTQVLQGTLEKGAGDLWLLRREPTVILEGHPRLDLFEAGAVIRVEGQLLPRRATEAGAAWLPHPRFQVKHVELIRRGA